MHSNDNLLKIQSAGKFEDAINTSPNKKRFNNNAKSKFSHYNNSTQSPKIQFSEEDCIRLD